MDNLIDELVRAARHCERAAKIFEKEPVSSMNRRLAEACQQVGLAWSGSFLGYQASIYIEGLRPRRPGEHFDTEWGRIRFQQSTGPWCEYTFDTVQEAILRRAEIADVTPLNEAVSGAGEAFKSAKENVLPVLDAILSSKEDPILRDLRRRIEELRHNCSADELARGWWPRGQQFSRDMLAISGGLRLPHHLRVQAWQMERRSWGVQAEELAGLIRQAVKYLHIKMQMKGATVAKTDGVVFIGHGGSLAWRDLKDFLQDRLGLQWEEFNREPTAGMSTKERLETMLDSASFAFLVMTAEDEKADGTKQARANVVHEAGLFQGRLGFERAIILLEDGCAEFSNIVGLTQIRFPKGNIMAKSEELRRVLEREGIIK